MSDKFENARVLEHGKRLSESLLWQLEYETYLTTGPTHWEVTNTPLLASTYARLIFAMLADWNVSGITAPINPSESINILELGAGTGKFSYLLLSALTQIDPRWSPWTRPNVRLIMTDNVHDYQRFWKGHERLKPLLDQGTLDFASFRADQDDEIQLLFSGETIAAEKLANPLVVIANYFFDQIPQDLFRVNSGRLQEGLVRLQSNPRLPNTTKLTLRRGQENSVQWAFEYRDIHGEPYPHAPYLDAIAGNYSQEQQAVVPFSLPTMGLRSLQNLLRISGNKMLSIIGDKGPLTPTQMATCACDRIIVDNRGLFSMNVNFDAIAKFVRHGGGEFWVTEGSTDRFHVALGMWGLPGAKARHLLSTYDNLVRDFGPAEYTSFLESTQSANNWLSLESLLVLLKLSHFDPRLLNACDDRVFAELRGASQSQRSELAAALDRVWKNFFCIDAADETSALRIAQLYYLSDCREKAVECLQVTSRQIPASAALYYYLGRCEQSLKRFGEAGQSYKQALQINPQHAQSQQALQSLL